MFFVRFLGGYGAWDDGSEDICDSVNCSKDVQKLVMKCRDDWSRETGVRVTIVLGEKAWTGFRFS